MTVPSPGRLGGATDASHGAPPPRGRLPQHEQAPGSERAAGSTGAADGLLSAADGADVALVDGAETVTYAALDRRANAFAAWLRAQGVGPDDRVALCLDGGVPFAVALLGCFRALAVAVPIDAQLTSDERQAVLSDLQPRLVVDAADAAAVMRAHRAPPDGLDGVDTVSASPSEHVQPPASRLSILPPTDDPGRTVLILYTSGSTGRPKGAVLAQRALQFALRSWAADVLGLGRHDTVLQVLPLAHSYGLCAGLLAPLLAGARIVQHQRFAADATLQALDQHGVTVFPGVATMFSRLLAHDPVRPPRLRLTVAGAAPCDDGLCAVWQARMGTRILRGYGMTELFRPISFRYDEPDDAPSSVGRPVPGVEVRLDANAELLIRTPAAMSGYLHAPEETRAVLHDGWFASGDLGAIDAQGRVTILGRTRERILRGGYSVFPAEVEAVLLDHPAVAEAAVVGAPHPELGEEVVAFVALRAALHPDALVDHCRRHLAAFKYPRRVVVLAALPRSAAGKILKSRLIAPQKEAAPDDAAH